MTEPWLSALVLGLGWFAAINIAASALAWCAASRLLSSPGANRGGVLLAIRLFPAVVSLVFAAALFVPAHWTLEPPDTQERYGLVVWALSAAGASLLLRSLGRAVSVARAGWRLRGCGALRQVDASCGVYDVPGLRGVSLAGVIRTRILVGCDVRRTLSPDELDVALAHERAHRVSLDNLKRFVMFCAPDVFGGALVAHDIEARWRATAEWLADARAVQGDDGRAVRLASALVKVSRLTATSAPFVTSPAWSTLHDAPLLEMRVRRLVTGTAPEATAPRRRYLLGLGAIAAAVLLSSGDVVYPALHMLTESMIRLLP